MFIDLVVSAPEPLQGGDRDQESTSWSKQGTGGAESAGLVRDVFQNVEHQDEVEPAFAAEFITEPGDANPVPPERVLEERRIGF
jgi:hypothetical protein